MSEIQFLSSDAAAGACNYTIKALADKLYLDKVITEEQYRKIIVQYCAVIIQPRWFTSLVRKIFFKEDASYVKIIKFTHLDADDPEEFTKSLKPTKENE